MFAAVILALCLSAQALAGPASFDSWIREKRTGAGECCTLDSLSDLQTSLEDNLNFISQSVLEVGFELQQFINMGLSSKYPAPSCEDLHYAKPYMPAGDYWIGKADHNPLRQHCDMDNMRPPRVEEMLIDLNMNDETQKCPEGLEKIWVNGNRLCRKSAKKGCSSIWLPAPAKEYTRVCGQARAFQVGTLNAFHRFHCDHCNTIDSPYVDGISITQGHPRRHVWSLAAAWTEFRDDYYRAVCPCAKGRGTAPPKFVGDNYYCEAGSKAFDAHDPLWDGSCSSKESDCCKPSKLPRFCVDVPRSRDKVEVRVCADQDRYGEDLYLESLKISVQ